MRIGLRPEDLDALRADSPARSLVPRRRLYGIGLGKTGTNALASVFTGVPAAHEAEAETVIDAVLEYDAGRSDWRRLRDVVVARDGRLGLAVDVSNVNIFLVDLLVALAPDARFVLTIRDPWSWLDSIMNHYLRRPPTARWKAFAERRFGLDGAAHPAEERALRELGLHPLAGYLSYWREHIRKALDTVPAGRLLVIRTERIAPEAERVAEFAGIANEHVDRSAIREYRNPQRLDLLPRIPRDHLESQVRRHCEPLLGHLFPDRCTPEGAGIVLAETESPP